MQARNIMVPMLAAQAITIAALIIIVVVGFGPQDCPRTKTREAPAVLTQQQAEELWQEWQKQPLPNLLEGKVATK